MKKQQHSQGSFLKLPSLRGKKTSSRLKKRRACQFEQLEARRVMAAAVWNNVGHPTNVDGDVGGVVSPLDALLVINEINSPRYSDAVTGELPKQLSEDSPGIFFDVSCDNFVSPIDALQVINHINQGGEAGTNGTGVYPSAACSPQLVEGTDFTEEFTHQLTLPDDSSAVRIHFRAPEFDTSSENSIRDAFEIELTDSEGNPVSFPFVPNRDAVYNWSELLEPQFGVGSETTTSMTPGEDSTLTVNLAGMEAGSTIRIAARLVNNDSDDSTSVLLRGFEVVDSAVPAPTGAAGASRRLPTRMPLNLDDLEDVSGSFVPTYGHTTLVGENNELFTTLEVTNEGLQAVTGRLIVAVDSISELDAAAMHPDGLLPDGRPYWDLTQEMDGQPLAPGETIRSREIAFLNDSGSRFSYKLSTYGSLNVAPTGFTSTPLVKIEAEDAYVYLAEAEDPDGQPLSYTKVAGPEGMQVDEVTGEVTWATTTDDIGAHSVILRATDPHGLYVEQPYTLEVVATLQNRPPIFVSDPVTEAIASSGFEITTVGVGDSPAGVAVVSGFRGPRLVTANAAEQTIGIYAGENNDRFDNAMAYSTGHPRREGRWIDAGVVVDFGFPEPIASTDDYHIATYDHGDFNADGFLDFVVGYHYERTGDASIGDFRAAVVLNDGNGSFGAPTVLFEQEIYSYNSYVRTILVEDVNADGHADVLFAEYHDGGKFVVSLGNGDGTFQPNVETSYENTIIGDFQVADIDGDGVQDLFGRTINSFSLGRMSRSLFWSKGIGDGTFQEPDVFLETRLSGARETSSAYDLSDLDGDGDLDVVLSGDYPVIQVFHNDGAGEFTLVNELTPPNAYAYYNPDWLVVGDFTGDGNKDILFHHVWQGYLHLMVGDESGVDFTFEEGTAIRMRPDNWAMGFEPMDIDGDGDLDIVYGTEFRKKGVTVGLNDGTGRFLLREYAIPDVSTGLKYSFTDATVRGALFGDYNADGVIDVSYFTTDSDFNGQTDRHALGILYGTRHGEFGRSRTEPWVTPSWNDVAHPGDFNGDGILDVLDTASDVTALGNGDGTFGDLIPAAGVRRPAAMAAVADYDNDGLDDVVSGLEGGLYVGLSNGDGTFSVNQNISGGGFYGYNTIDPIDLNLDGYMDFVVKEEVGRYFEAYLNDPLNPGSFTMSFTYSLGDGSQGVNVSNWEESWDVGDYTGDGIPDLITAEREDFSGAPIYIVVFAGDGEGGFNRYSEVAGYGEAEQAGIYGSRVEPGDFATGDIDNDGDLDLLAHSYLGARVLLNDGSGNFTRSGTWLDAVRTHQRGRDSWLVDFDGDGNLDFVKSTAGDIVGAFYFWKGDGAGNFALVEGVNMHGEMLGIREPFFDWDNDGHLDLVYNTGDTTSDEIAFYMGRRDDLVDMITVDLNGDGNEEVLAVQEQMERLQIFVGDNLGGLTRQNDLQAGLAPQAVAAADLDGDGQMELLVANRVGRDVTVFSGDLESGYSQQNFAVGDVMSLATRPIDIATAEATGDDHQDVFVLDAGNQALWVFPGNGTATLGTPTAIPLGDQPGHFVLEDATGDGVLDAVVTLPDSNRLMILSSIGSESIGAPIYVDLDHTPSDVAVLDLNADGQPELAATIADTNVLSVHYGLGGNQFARAQEVTVGQSPTRVVPADADEDGRMDLVVTNSGDDTVSVIYNRFDPNEVYRYDSDAIDPDDDTLTYSIVDGPGGLIINGQSGQLLWAASPDQVGVHDVTISADDGRGGIATQSFKIEVEPARENAPPLIASVPETQLGAGDSFHYQLDAIDSNGHPLRYRLLDGPKGATLEPVTGELTWDTRKDSALSTYIPGVGTGYVRTPANESLQPKSITVEGWFNWSQLPASNGADYLFYQSSSRGVAYGLQNRFNDRLRFEAHLEGGYEWFEIPLQFESDRWYHFALTIDDSTNEFAVYADGQLIASNTLSESIAYSDRTISLHDNFFQFQGATENYRIWNTARTAEQISEGLSLQYETHPNLVLDYRFGGKGTRSIHDYSGNGNHGYRVFNGQAPGLVDGLSDPGPKNFTIAVEDGRGGYDEQSFELHVLPELRGSIQGHLFEDLNGDGDQDDGSEEGVPEEPNLAGWHLWIDSNGNAYPDPHEPQTTTDADGNYSFEGLLPGEYPVSSSPVAGYATPEDFTATVEPEIVRELDPAAATNYDLAIEQLSLSQIRGQLRTEDGDAIAYWKAYADLDGDGQRDENEPLAMSDREGNFALTGLDAGTYTIRPDLPAGWADMAGRDGLEVTLGSDEVSRDNDFTLEPTNTSVTGGVHFVTMPSTAVEARQTFTYASVAMGISEAAISYDLSLAPEGMVIDPNTGLVAWRPTIDQVGEHLVILRATDASGSISLHDFTLDVSAPNTAPVIVAPAASAVGGERQGASRRFFTAYAESVYSHDVIAQDAESTTLAFALTEAPAGATIDTATGRLNWTPAASAVGSHDFTVEVTDADGAITSATWTVNVQDSSPSVLPLDVVYPRTTAAVTADYFSRITATDAIGRPVTWLMTSGPSGLTIASDGTIEWTPGTAQLGSQPVELTATTADGATETVAFDIEVLGRALNAAPSIDSEPTTSVSLGQAFEYRLSVSDADGDIHAFTLLDGPIGMSVHPSLGTVSWTPAADQLGEHDVLLQVSDPAGDTAEQAFTLAVSRFGGPPRIVSIPPTEAGVGSAFLYSVEAVDREGDPLTYSLLAAPAGMTLVETTGELSWTPAADQVGDQDVVIQVSDGIGGAATQAFVVRVSAGAVNLPPEITSSAPRFGAVGTAYSYAMAANDPENTPITYALGRGPSGMTVDSATGQVSWTPVAGDEGKVVVTLLATDEGGATAVESFELDVLGQNTRPTIHSTPPVQSTAGALFMVDVLASDADLDALTFELTEAPSGAEIDAFGRIRWQTALGDEGDYDFEVKVRDPRGGEVMQSFTLQLVEDTEGPKVSLIERPNDASRNVLPWMGPFVVYAKAIDNVEVASLTLTANGQDIPLDAAGTATFAFEDWFFNTVRATATAIDTSGNETTRTITFNYDVPEGWSTNPGPEVPTAIITSPADNGTAVGMVSITGTADHEDFGAYTLSYRRADETSFTEFFRSTTPVVDGELGVWDTSLLMNDEYVIRLQVATTEGAANVVEHSVGLAGELKLGNFQLSFTDMVIPVAGIPIEITRIYDTLQADRQGDFGYGWRLEYRNTDLRVGLPSSGLEDIGIYSALRPGVKVFLNVPGEGRQGFTFDPDIRVLPGWGGNNLVLARPRFTPDPGVTSTLGTGTSSYLQVNERGELYAPGGIPYNPASPDFGGAYVLTTLNGTRYRIDGATGLLESAQTRSGVGLQFSSDAIASSSGTRITIARDQSNRITSITDTANQTIEYRYQNDDLLEVIDRDGNSTQFAYSPTRDHYLESIIDPFGRVGVRQEYDDRGRLIAVIDSNGNRTEFNFDTDVSTNTIRDPLGRETRLVYDNRGNILLEIDPLGDATEYEYDSFGNETSITDPLGNTQRFDYRSDGQLTATTDPSGQVTRYQYGSSGDVTAVVNALGQISLSGINSNGGVESITNAAGSTIDFELNSLGVPTSIQFNDGLRIQTTYDSEGREVSTVDPVGNLVSFERDSRGNLTGQVIEYEDSDGQIRRIEASSLYNADGLLLESVDPLGNVLKNLYDAAGRLVERRLPNNRTEQRSYNSSGQLSGLIFGDGASVRYAYDPVGNVVEITDESGRTTRFEYDDANRVIREIYPDASPEDISDNPAVAYEYNSAGRVTAAIDENGERTEFEYDSRGLQSLVRDPLGNEIRFEYDALGRRTALVDELDRRTEIAYDAIGNPIAATFPDGTNETATFDNFGNRTSVTNALGRTTRFEYDAVGRLIRTVNPLGHATSYSHDSLGNLTEITDANGNVTSFEYDDIGRRIGETLPLGQRLTIEYDEIGQPISYVDQNGNEFGLEYDERGRLVKRTFANDPDITYSYTPTGQLASVTNGTGTATYEYDERDRIVRQVDVNGAIVEYAYDPAGYLTSLSVDGSTTTYEHDEAGRLVSVASPDGQATTYGYDDAGQLILETKPNGVETLFDRDLRDRILSVVHRDNEANILASFEYTYDAIGQRTQVVDSDGDTVVWSYDQLNRLVSEVRSNAVDSVSLTFTYDAVGNRLSQVHSQLGSTTYQYDSNDRLIQKFSAEGTTDYRYDENGNLIEQIGTDGSRRELTWDDMNQLVAIAEVENGSTTNYQYTFDSAGRRIEEQSDGEVKQFVWADIGGIDEVVRETTESETSEYVFGLNRISQATDGQTYYFGSDAHSGTRILTDAAGIAVQQYSYDAFGNLVESPATPVTSYLYRGQYRGPDGLDYLKVRHLDPTDGRFLSRDPFNGVPSDPGTLVDYVYAGNNPVNASDPSGAATLPDLSAALTVGKIINAALFAFFVGVKTASSVKAGTFSAGKFFEIVAFEAAFAAAGFGIGRVGGAAIAKALVPATKSSAFQAAARQLGGFHAVMRAGINSPKSYAAFNALAHAINQKATVVGSKVAQGLLKNLPSTIRVTGKRGLEQVTVTVFSYPGLQASKKGVEEAAKATLRKAGIKFGEESLKVVFVSSTKVPSANLPQLVGLLSQMLFTASEVGFHVLFGLQLDVPKDE